MTDQLLPVILCGGSGTRLWPLSRETYPKQFHALAGDSSMLQDTATRLHGISGDIALAAPLLVCNIEHRFLVATQLQQAHIENAKILLEPTGRNTAPALTIAALQAVSAGADPIMLAMPADHVISDRKAFHESVQVAFNAARAGQMVTFGIVADRPETGYGYIQHGTTEQGGTFEVQSFVEKPDLERAQSYLAAGNYLWNSGLFVVRASVWLKAMKAFRPDILSACEQSMNGAQRDMDFVRPEEKAFKSSPSDSIDYAVMEGAERVVVAPVDPGWSDVGGWAALHDLGDKDEAGNVRVGDVIAIDAKDNYLRAGEGKRVAVVGVSDLIVVTHGDDILVIPRDRAQEVKAIVEYLAANSPRER